MKNIFNSRQFKMIVIIGLSLSALFLVLMIASRLILLDSFVEIEQSNVRKNVERAINALNGELTHLATVNGDYAGWDDSYQFILNGNKEFLDANLPDTVFPSLRLNMLIYIKNNGDIVYGRAYDLNKEAVVPVPESLYKHISPESPLLRHPGTESLVKGLLRLPDGILLVI